LGQDFRRELVDRGYGVLECFELWKEVEEVPPHLLTCEQTMGTRSRHHVYNLNQPTSIGFMFNGGGLEVACQLEGNGDMIAIRPPFVRDVVDLPFQGIQKLRNGQFLSWISFHYT
jgi:hypothetical protein